MNKRQIKKRDKKLFRAIVELNELVAEDFEVEINMNQIQEVFKKIKRSDQKIKQTMNDHRRYVLLK